MASFTGVESRSCGMTSALLGIVLALLQCNSGAWLGPWGRVGHRIQRQDVRVNNIPVGF